MIDLRDRAVEHACRIIGSGLDETSWSRYVPDIPYSKSCPT
jgi:hypothetical protein